MFTNPVFDNTNTLDFAGRAPNILVRSGRARGNLAMTAWSQDFGRSWTPLRLPALTERTDPDNRRREIEAVVTVSADGVTFIATTKMLTRDRGQSWIAVRGLPDFARPVTDRVDARRFYVLDFEHSRIAVSDMAARVSESILRITHA
jgi:hypothetical protein